MPGREALLRSPDRLRWLPSAFLLVVVIGVAAFTETPSPAGMSGYSLRAAEREREIEVRFRSLVSSEEITRVHRYLTARPHPAGSARNNELARWIADQWREQGLEDVTIHEYDVLHSSPREISLEMIRPTHYQASLHEDPYEVDPDTKDPDALGSYFGYSASGEVTAPVVYAHSGNPEDYEYLRRRGIDVRGKIVLVRYSNPYSYRGFKALTAEKLGAAAILIYSDPAEDGFKQGPVFPDGRWGPESHIQHGAITYDFLQPGDPLTPGWASVPGAKTISPLAAVSLPKIIGIPLSWHDAKPLLENLGGPAAPLRWQGGLPFTYRLGGNRVRVHLKVQMDTRVQPYYVTEARIRGSEFPDEWLILGNHRDAWVFGGMDPGSGTASMLELTRDLGSLLKDGIRPKRTLVFCSWDGEEYALTGSTEWGEQYAEDLKRKGVAYLNEDIAVSGKDFQADAVGSLAPVVVEMSRSLDSPGGGLVYDNWKASRRAEMHAEREVADSELVNTRIGSGSDHTVFLNFLGIPTVALAFTGPYGVYHSKYDDFYWMDHLGDPGYHYHAVLTKMWGSLALRLANAEVLPYDFEIYGANIRKFVSELDVNTHASGQIVLGPLLEQVAEFQAAGRDMNHSIVQALAGGELPAEAAVRVNSGLMQVERNWCNPDGIPGRPWFKHSLYAARYTYAHLELPGLTEAAEAGDWKRAAEQAKILEDGLRKNVALLRQARRELDEAGTLKP